jgi:hemerythrin
MFNHATGNIEQERDYFGKVIQKAVNYIKTHFATEEKIMKTFKFAGYTEHKREHEKFIFEVLDKISEYKSGNRLTLSSFTRFLRDWALTHIAHMDKLYFDYLRKVATRKADGTLSVTLNDV